MLTNTSKQNGGSKKAIERRTAYSNSGQRDWRGGCAGKTKAHTEENCGSCRDSGLNTARLGTHSHTEADIDARS